MEDDIRAKSLPENYGSDAVRVLNTMSFTKGKSIGLLGSMSLRSQQYAGDYDAFEIVNMKERTDEVALHSLATRFKQIIKELRAIPHTYIGDIKAGSVEEWRVLPKRAMVKDGKVVGMDVERSKATLDRLRKDNVITEKEHRESLSLLDGRMTPMKLLEAKKELKFHIVRWTPPEVERGFKVLRDKRKFTLEEAFSTPTITKMDVISLVQNNRYTDFSMIYYFRNNGKLLNPDVIDIVDSLKENILYYSETGNPFKVLKRRFALAKFEKDADTITQLTPILNSDLGRIYHVLGDIGTLIRLLDDYKPDPKIVRFEIDQFRNRLANVYQLKDYLKEEHTLIGEITSLLKAPLKQMLPKLETMETQLERILRDGTDKVMGQRTELTGAGVSIRSQGLSGFQSEYNQRLNAGMGGEITSGTTLPEMEQFVNSLIGPQDLWRILTKLVEGLSVYRDNYDDWKQRATQLVDTLTQAVNEQYANAKEVVSSVVEGDADAVGTALKSAEAVMNAAEAMKSASPASLLQQGAETLISVLAAITSPDFNKPMGVTGYSAVDEMKGQLAKLGLSNAFTDFSANIVGNLMKAFGYKTQAELNQPVVDEVLKRKESESKQMLEDFAYAIQTETEIRRGQAGRQAKASAENRQSIKDKRQYEKDIHFTLRPSITFEDWKNLQRGGYGVALMDGDRLLKVYPTLRDAQQQGSVEFTAGYPSFKVVPLGMKGGALDITKIYPVGGETTLTLEDERGNPTYANVSNKDYVFDLITALKQLAHFYSFRDPATALGFRVLGEELWKKQPLYEGNPERTTSNKGHQNAIDFTMESMLGVNRRNRFPQPNPTLRYEKEVQSLFPFAYGDAARLQPKVDAQGRLQYDVPPRTDEEAVFYLQDAPYIRGPTMYR